jgi:hypothetical protein
VALDKADGRGGYLRSSEVLQYMPRLTVELRGAAEVPIIEAADETV